MRIPLPPCPKCAGQLHIEYPTARFVILNVTPEAVCWQCGWRRGLVLRPAAATDPALVTASDVSTSAG